MNGDTPGAVPSDETPFLGPAISPRRREGGAPAPDVDELAGPFVGRKFGSTVGESSASLPEAAEGALPALDESYDDAFGGTGDAERLEDLPAAAWPEDDFPWLLPEEPEGASTTGEAPWRATGEVEELTQPEPSAGGVAGSSVDHFSWIGERLPEEVAGEAGPAADGGAAGTEEEVGGFPWDEEPAAEGSSAGFGGGEDVGGFDSGFDAQEAWGRAAEWSPEPAAGGVEGEAEPAAGFDWGEAVEGAGPEPVAADRWDAGEGFQVEEEAEPESPVEQPAWGEPEPVPASSLAAQEEVEAEVEVLAPEAGVEQTEPVAASVEATLEPSGGVAAEPVEADEPPVETAPLPVGEWEAAPDEAQVEAAPAGEENPLVEVAERLERIAQALRSGRPIESLEGGDPLQLLIAGYALGFSKGKGGRD